MALKPDTNATMSGRITAADANYPHGSSKDETSPGAGDGTPYFKARADDIFGLQQALLVDGDVTPSGNADTALLSDYLQAASNVLKQGGFKNALVNGDFSINQRGLAFTPSTNAYTSDQWEYEAVLDGGVLSGEDVTVQPFALGQTDVPGNPIRFLEYQGAIVGGSGNDSLSILNRIEGVESYASELVTLSFWVKGSINGTARHVMTQNFGTGGGESAEVRAYDAEDITVTTSWQRVTHTFTMPAVAGKAIGANGDDSLKLMFNKHMGATAAATLGAGGANTYTGVVSISDVQLERGRYASRFERLQVAQMFAICQRYYQELTIGGNSPRLFRGGLAGAMNSDHLIHPVAMRATPSTTNATPVPATVSFGALNGGAATGAVTLTGSSNGQTWALSAAGTATNGSFYGANWGGTSEIFTFSAEL